MKFITDKMANEMGIEREKMVLSVYNGTVVMSCYGKEGEVVTKVPQVPFSEKKMDANAPNLLSVLGSILRRFNTEENKNRLLDICLNDFEASMINSNILQKMVRTGKNLKGRNLSEKMQKLYAESLDAILSTQDRVLIESTKYIKHIVSDINDEEQNAWAKLYEANSRILNPDAFAEEKTATNKATGTDGEVVAEPFEEEDDLPF